MNKPLQISLLFNAALLGCLIFVWTMRPPATIPAAAVAVSPAVVRVPPPPAPASSVAAPLRWTQLYSQDYHIYVKNLRAIGCPEPSVRAIVTADVDSVFQIIGSRLEQKLAAMAQAPLSNQIQATADGPKLREDLQKLPAKENAMITDLLGLNPAREASVAVSAPASASPVPMPLVMQDVDLSALNFTAEQIQEVASVKEDFLKQTAGVNPDLNDPAVQARWREAQIVADSMLMAFLGNAAYTQYEFAAHQRLLDQIEAARH